jgi:hypothetical protein
MISGYHFTFALGGGWSHNGGAVAMVAVAEQRMARYRPALGGRRWGVPAHVRSGGKMHPIYLQTYSYGRFDMPRREML